MKAEVKADSAQAPATTESGKQLPDDAEKKPSQTEKARKVLTQSSERARNLAAVILDVLAGNRTPGDAARVLELSVARYYVLEQRAILGMVTACDSQPKRGPGQDLQLQIHRLEQEKRQLNQALLRQQAVVRSTQRGLGIRPPKVEAKPKPGVPGVKRRRLRRPSVRALRLARRVAPDHSHNPVAPDIIHGDQHGG